MNETHKSRFLKVDNKLSTAKSLTVDELGWMLNDIMDLVHELYRRAADEA